MKTKRNPFKAQKNWQNNACITNYMQFVELSNYYMQSADTLVQHSLENNSSMDVHVYAICLLYRHSTELLLKDLLWKSNYAVKGHRNFSKTHRLPQLWSELFGVVDQLCVGVFSEMRKKAPSIKTFLKEVDKHDPESDGFRYPFDRKMSRSHKELAHVNLPLLQESFHLLHDDIGFVYEVIEREYDMRTECNGSN